MEYGVNVTNKFKFLSDDEAEDPLESLAKAEAAKKDKPALSKKDKKAAAAVKQVAAVPPPKAEPEKPQRQANKENIESRDRGGPRGPRGGGRGRVNFAERKDAGNRQADANHDVMSDRFGESRPPRGGGGDRGGYGGRGGGRGFRGGDRGGFRGRPKSDTHDSGFRSGGETEEENRGPRGGGGGGRGFRGGPRRGFALRGDRHPGGDRHSGSDRTGVRQVPKREGYGKGNWGTENDELTGETEPVPPVSDTEVQKVEDRPVGEDGAQETDQEEKKKAAEEEEKANFTLEEWKALHQKVDQPNFNTRRAGEGQDQKIYSKLVPLKKDDEPEEHEEVVIVRREPREKPLNIEVNFSDSSRPRGGGERGFRGGRDRDDFRGGRGGDREDFRGGRGGDRDDFRGGRGGDRRDFRGGRTGRGGGRRADNFALNDEAFPALGKA
uniref:Hyaluronan/mRNA-binding protein domain-containing protein n=1 Tax=Acrobeloides nanus TaxID=290746 RepID=A0A914BW37_9BILA